jgi:hypothetical protein
MKSDQVNRQQAEVIEWEKLNRNMSQSQRHELAKARVTFLVEQFFVRAFGPSKKIMPLAYFKFVVSLPVLLKMTVDDLGELYRDLDRVQKKNQTSTMFVQISAERYQRLLIGDERAAIAHRQYFNVIENPLFPHRVVLLIDVLLIVIDPDNMTTTQLTRVWSPLRPDIFFQLQSRHFDLADIVEVQRILNPERSIDKRLATAHRIIENAPEKLGPMVALLQSLARNTPDDRRVEILNTVYQSARICETCKKWGFGLPRCSACLRYAYCDEACQRKHWKNGHREACEPVVAVLE